MRFLRRRLGVAVLVAGIAACLALPAAASESEEYAEEELDDCLDCHDETEKYPVLPILVTKHAVKADERTPLAQQHECQTCHGPSAEHTEDENSPTSIVFGNEAPPGPQNEVCLGCHQGGDRINWQGSTHASSEIACVGCHKVHARQDPVMALDRRPDTPVFRKTQMAVCFQCHINQRANIHKTSSHPLRDGLIQCSDCHNPHGSTSLTNLVKPTLNETCYTCHAEKRGPFLWEHAPASENCGTCHTPHGSNHAALLTARTPQLCQRCHLPGFHPSAAYGGPNYSNPVPGGTPVGDRRVFARNCMNCHPEVHGSNHPSGVRQTR